MIPYGHGQARPEVPHGTKQAVRPFSEVFSFISLINIVANASKSASPSLCNVLR